MPHTVAGKGGEFWLQPLKFAFPIDQSKCTAKQITTEEGAEQIKDAFALRAHLLSQASHQNVHSLPDPEHRHMV